MISVLLRTEITSPEHEAELKQLAEEGKYEYGVKKKYFFVEIELDDTQTPKSKEANFYRNT